MRRFAENKEHFLRNYAPLKFQAWKLCRLNNIKTDSHFHKLHKSNASPGRCAENKNRDYICIFTESCPFVIFSIEIVSAL